MDHSLSFAPERDLDAPPHSEFAERSVLGALLRDPTCLVEVSDILAPHDFYAERNRAIFAAMQSLARDGQPPEAELVADRLRQLGTYERAGGLEYLLFDVDGATATTAFVQHHARIVQRTSVKRQIISKAQAIAEMAYADKLDVPTSLQQAQQLLAELTERYAGDKVMHELPFVTLCDLLATTPPQPTWAIPRLCAVGAVTDLVGKVKVAGKTTLLAAGARAAITGGLFLGQPAPRAPVVYLTEQPDASLAEELVAAGLKDLDDHRDLLFVRRRDVLGVVWPDIVTRAANLADRAGARSVIMDTILAFAGLTAEQAENDATAAQQAMGPVVDVVSHGRLGVVVSRHEGKGPEREVGEAGRGSSAWAGAADQLCVLRRPDGRQRPTIRQLDTLSRFQDLDPTAMIEWRGQGGYAYVGSDEQVQLAAARSVLCDFAPATAETAVKIDQLLERCPKDRRPARTTAYRAVEELVQDGDLHTRGEGIRGSPRVYWRAT